MGEPKEPIRKEMLEFIKDMEHCPDWDWEPESLEILQAIRRLIEKFFEWQKRAIIVVEKVGEDEPYPSKMLDLLDLIIEIRDFGKETK